MPVFKLHRVLSITSIICLWIWVVIWVSVNRFKSMPNELSMQKQANTIEFCKQKWYNYIEKATQLESDSRWQMEWVWNTQIISEIQCDWFSPIEEPNQAILFTRVSKYCEMASPSEDFPDDPMWTIFDCTTIFNKRFNTLFN